MEGSKPVKKRVRESGPPAKEEEPAADGYVDSSEEEDLDEPNAYELDGFVVDSVEEEEDERDGTPRRQDRDSAQEDEEEEERSIEGEAPHDDGGKKKRKRKHPRHELEEDDLSLIEEAQGGKRSNRGGASRLKRLRKKAKTGGVAPANDMPDAENFSKTLFGEEDPQRRKQRDAVDYNSEEEEGLGGFIVHTDELGQEVPLRGYQNRKRGGTTSITETQFEVATQIFGDISEWAGGSAGRNDDDLEYRDREDYEDARDLDIGMPSSRLDRQKAGHLLEQQFEPSVLEENYITAADEKIKGVDIPERLQLRASHEALPQVEGVLNKEAEWIYMRAFVQIEEFKNREAQVIPQIIAVLEFLHKENFEVPFIATYRKDYITEFSRGDLADKSKHLWTIYDWDEKFIHLLTRKSNLRQLYTQFSTINEDYISLLEQSQTDIEVRDLHDHIQLHYAADVEATTTHKRPVKRNYYNICKKEGIAEFANQGYFGISADQFGENLLADLQMKEPRRVEITPAAAAADWLAMHPTSSFRTVHEVIKGARHVLSKEIAHDPRVRHSLRNTFAVRAYVNTAPTPRGDNAITRQHMFYDFKRLSKKPTTAFSDTEFLMIEKAEKEGLLTVTIEIPPAEHESDFLGEMEHLYLSNGTDAVTAEWNEERKRILQDALNEHLYPLFANEVRHQLREDAEQRVINDSIRKLNEMLNRRPYITRLLEDRSADDRSSFRHDRENITAMACTWGSGTSMSYAVIIDCNGELVAELKLPFMNCRSDEFATPNDRRRKEEDLHKISQFISVQKPNVIALGAVVGEPEARRFFEDIKRVANDTDRRVHVTVVDAQVPRIYSTMERAVREFPDKPSALRQTISLGRMLLDPLNEYAALCDRDGVGILCLRLHPMQDIVRDQLLVQAQRCFIDTVNKVGVDINKIVLHKESQYVLQFVAGLGPRKAQALLQAINREGGMIASREDIDSILQPPINDAIIGSTVSTNAIGFLRVRRKWFPSESVQVDPLDDTRVHPDDVSFARKMAYHALDSNEDEDQWQYLVEELMKDPNKSKKLSEIDLDSFAEEWERGGRGKKLKTLYDIKRELISPFAEARAIPYSDPSEEQVFTMLTGETPDTLYSGLVVSATASSVSTTKVICKLDNGLTGVIMRDGKDSLPEFIVPGTSLLASVVSIDTSKFLISLRPTNETRGEQALKNKLWLVPDEEVHVPRKHEEKRSQAQQRVAMNRRVEHPLFRPQTCKDAEALLASMDFGEHSIVIRPSSKGLDHLTISWKFTNNVIIHTDVLEKDKQAPMHVGRRLIVAGKTYEDFDEILYRHITPLIHASRDVQRHSHYQANLVGKESVTEYLRACKTKTPRVIPYAITASADLPGKFVLSYQPNNSVRNEYISVSPDGLRFRSNQFKTLDKLIMWFKSSFSRQSQSRQQHQRSEQRSGRSAHGSGHHQDTQEWD
eukprot:TRINITY_DN5544_c0_g1_i1.p1 TRINITY_DN5544_c0_g1~~TRINITY_DN5544_c0_g1_i1.p1  ORF type:complete len:1445 (+),score=255.12 TRINITY_DN5544_c0_g1_i1:88-4422(+)